jgi:hypothetical protein
MPKRIVILDPNGIGIAVRDEVQSSADSNATRRAEQLRVAMVAGDDLTQALSENPQLGTYTVTVKEIGDD